MPRPATNLEQLLDQLATAGEGRECVSLGAMVNAVGRRSFGPLLVFAGLVLVSPVSGIPGLPTLMGVLLVLTAGQLLLGREQFWLPRWLLRRAFDRSKLRKAIRWLRPPARWVDRVVKPRLLPLVQGVSQYFVAIICGAVALGLPVMEVVPFSASIAGVAIAAFGVALIAEDGAVALVAYGFTGGAAGLLALGLLGND